MAMSSKTLSMHASIPPISDSLVEGGERSFAGFCRFAAVPEPLTSASALRLTGCDGSESGAGGFGDAVGMAAER